MDGGTAGDADGGGVAVAPDVIPEIIETLAEEEPLFVRDVEVMRRLYRSGESEYLIDGEMCRLRDVQDLLMDAGVGVKAYAVIEQGKIGQILSARPTDRRQLIEEAAGVTKYKSRRRSAELKLEAAQQNLTRVDDIVFEVEKQRGTLKRQAAKARRYKRLREELRRWEKVQFAQRYRVLGEAIETARTELAGARERETTAAARLAELETTLERLRLELMEADGQATAAREAAHASEMEIGRLQQQIAFDRQQIAQLTVAAAEIEAEVVALDARQEPARLELDARREAARRAGAERDEAAATLAAEESAYVAAQRQIEGLEADVEAARSEVFAAVNAATALRHAMEHAVAARARMAEQIAALDVEDHDLGVDAGRAAGERTAAADALERARSAMEALRIDRAARESELLGARADRDTRATELRTREHDLAALCRAPDVARGVRRRPRTVRRRRPHHPRRVARGRRPDGIGCRLPRSRSPLRACGRSVPGRIAAARRRRVARARGGRPAARPRIAMPAVSGLSSSKRAPTRRRSRPRRWRIETAPGPDAAHRGSRACPGRSRT